MRSTKQNTTQLLFFVLVGFLALLLLRFLGRFFVFILILAAIGFLAYLVYQFIQERFRQKSFAESVEGHIQEKLNYCQQQIGKLEQERKTIRQNIQELQVKLNPDYSIAAKTQQETHRLIQAFEKEFQLRSTKIRFYELCIKKLKSLLHNYHLTQELEHKQQELKRLQENHYEDIATLEELKANIEFDRTYLETIDHLSSRMLNSSSLEEAQFMQLELESMTRELEEGD